MSDQTHELEDKVVNPILAIPGVVGVEPGCDPNLPGSTPGVRVFFDPANVTASSEIRKVATKVAPQLPLYLMPTKPLRR